MKSEFKSKDQFSFDLSYKMHNNVKTLWIWDTLPQKGLKSDEQTWLNEGDAVENVHRLTLGNLICNKYYQIGLNCQFTKLPKY